MKRWQDVPNFATITQHGGYGEPVAFVKLPTRVGYDPHGARPLDGKAFMHDGHALTDVPPARALRVGAKVSSGALLCWCGAPKQRISNGAAVITCRECGTTKRTK